MREPMLMAPGTGAATVALSCPWLSAASGWARATATLGVAYLRASKNEPLVDAKSLARSFVGEREDEAGISAALTVGPPPPVVPAFVVLCPNWRVGRRT